MRNVCRKVERRFFILNIVQYVIVNVIKRHELRAQIQLLVVIARLK